MTTSIARIRALGLALGAAAALMCCKAESGPDSEDNADEVWNNEDVATVGHGLYKGSRFAMNGDYNYCDGAILCVGGEGDCDSNAECTGGAVCGKDNGASFGMPKSWDVCVVSHCTNHLIDADETGADCGGADCGACSTASACPGTNGDLDYCATGCTCAQGQGDCDYDTDCAAGLVCKRKIGSSFGLPADTDVCVAAHCRDAKRDFDETGKDCGGADCNECPSLATNGYRFSPPTDCGSFCYWDDLHDLATGLSASDQTGIGVFALGSLTDGVRGLNDWTALPDPWVGWSQKVVRIDFRFPASRTFTAVTVGINNWDPPDVQQPSEIDVEFSNDGVTFTGLTAFRLVDMTMAAIPPGSRQDVVLTLPAPHTATFVRLTVVPTNWTFLDEVTFAP